MNSQYDTQGWNRYAYVKNNPVRYKDPSGNEGETGFSLSFDYNSAQGQAPVNSMTPMQQALADGRELSDKITAERNKPDYDKAILESLQISPDTYRRIKSGQKVSMKRRDGSPLWVTGKESRKLYNFMKENKMTETLKGMDEIYLRSVRDERPQGRLASNAGKPKKEDEDFVFSENKEEYAKLQKFLKAERNEALMNVNRPFRNNNAVSQAARINLFNVKEFRFDNIHIKPNDTIHFDNFNGSKGVKDLWNHFKFDFLKIHK